MDLTALPITHRAVIPDSYRDDMGHMNVMWYTYLFDRATVALFGLFGMDRAHLETNRAGCFALTQHFRYLAEVHIGKHVTVRSRVLGRSAKRFHLMHFMVIDDADRLAATAEFLGTYIDMTVRRSAPLPPTITEAFDRLLAEHSRVGWDAPACGAMHP